MAVTAANQRYLFALQGDAVTDQITVDSIEIVNTTTAADVVFSDKNGVVFHTEDTCAANATTKINFTTPRKVDGLTATTMPVGITAIIHFC